MKKKFFVTANIVGTATLQADNIEEANRLAMARLSRQFQLRPTPAGVIVFDMENLPKENDRVTAGG